MEPSPLIWPLFYVKIELINVSGKFGQKKDEQKKWRNLKPISELVKSSPFLVNILVF